MLILIVEDDEALRDILEITYREKNIQCHTVSSPEAAIAFLKEVRPDIILLDLVLDKGLGVEVADFAQQTYLHPPQIIFMSAYPLAKSILKNHYNIPLLEKPFNLEDLENMTVH